MRIGSAMGPPAELLRGRAGLEAWHNEAKATVQAAQQLRGRCWREALAQWRPPHPPGQPQETPYERRTRLQGWRFKLDVTEAGETLEKPPEGPGITLWKSKMKPPPWVSQLPLPCFRDHCVSQSNGLAARYASAVRLVVSRLHQALTELNEQAKRLNLARQRLDAALAKVRTALLTNQQSALVRGHRPPAEQVRAPDQVDALLRWERKELQRLKVELEGDMDMSEAHLKALGNCQHTLSMLCQERGQVLELLGQPLRMVLLEAERESWLSLSRPSSPFVVRNPTPEPSPVGPYTPECAAAIEEARCLTLRSKEVLATLKAATAQATASRHQAQVALDGSLQRKMDETLALKVWGRGCPPLTPAAFSRGRTHWYGCRERRYCPSGGTLPSCDGCRVVMVLPDGGTLHCWDGYRGDSLSGQGNLAQLKGLSGVMVLLVEGTLPSYMGLLDGDILPGCRG
uniref:Tektin like 1 n=1 Tax=Chelonoidis abingdonii TaxID=106734 RepID=A0A8C0GTS5_CHEAB